MKIGFLLHSNAALGGLGSGVRIQGLCQAEALERLGHRVSLLNPWQLRLASDHDVVSFFGGGPAFHGIEGIDRSLLRVLAFAPIIDSNRSFRSYRMAARIGSLWPGRLMTVAGELRRQAHAADVVVCRSRHERERMVRSLGIPRRRCEIVLNGVDAPQASDPEGTRRKLDLPQEFALHVSAYTQTRKNVACLLRAVGPTGLPLVVAGSARAGKEYDVIRGLADEYSNVRLLGWLDERVLADLYAACRVFCLPSLHEGTGLAALEAAASGARVVITKRGGPPDYFGALADYVDPSRVESIRAALLRAWDRPKTDELKHHVLRNLTWDASARGLVEAYSRPVPPEEAMP